MTDPRLAAPSARNRGWSDFFAAQACDTGAGPTAVAGPQKRRAVETPAGANGAEFFPTWGSSGRQERSRALGAVPRRQRFERTDGPRCTMW